MGAERKLIVEVMSKLSGTKHVKLMDFLIYHKKQGLKLYFTESARRASVPSWFESALIGRDLDTKIFQNSDLYFTCQFRYNRRAKTYCSTGLKLASIFRSQLFPSHECYCYIHRIFFSIERLQNV